MNYGIAISYLREKKNIKQEELADKLGISQTYLSLIENNREIPSMSLLSEIAAHLSTCPDALILISADSSDIPQHMIGFYRSISRPLRDFIDENNLHDPSIGTF